jgi:hypothetical protein
MPARSPDRDSNYWVQRALPSFDEAWRGFDVYFTVASPPVEALRRMAPRRARTLALRHTHLPIPIPERGYRVETAPEAVRPALAPKAAARKRGLAPRVSGARSAPLSPTRRQRKLSSS